MAERSLIGLVRDSISEFSAIVREIVTMGKAELKRETAKAATGAALMLSAVIVLPIVILLLILVVGFALTEFGWPLWLAFLVDAALWLIIAGGLGFAGLQVFKKVHGPTQTIAAAKKAASEFGLEADAAPQSPSE